jgi:phage-related protein
MDADKLSIDINEIRDLDLSVLLNINLDDAIRPVLRLEDLENIDWESATSYVLGITDPIGQLRDFLASLLTGFFDSIRGLLNALISPMADMLNRIWNTLSVMSNTISQLTSNIQNVVLTPIYNAIQFISESLSRLRDLFMNLYNTFVQAIQSIPGQVSNIVSQIAKIFSGAVDNIRNAISNIANAVATLPNVISDVISRIGNIVGDMASRIQVVLSELANRISQIPSVIADVLSRIASFAGDVINRIQNVLGEVTQRISQIPGVISDVVARISSAVGELANRLQLFFGEMVNRIQQGFSTIINALQQAGSAVGDFLNRARETILNVVGVIIQNIQNIPNAIRQVVDQIVGAFSNIVNAMRDGLNLVMDQMRQIPDVLRNAVTTFIGWLGQAFESLRNVFSQVVDQARQIPAVFNDIVKQMIGAADAASGIVLNAFRQVGDWIQKATTLLHQVAGALMGFVNTLQRLPGELWNLLPNEIKAAFRAIYDFFTKTVPETIVNFIKSVQAWWSEFSKDPLKWISDNVLKPLRDTLAGLLSNLWNILPNEIKAILQGIYDFFTKTVPEAIVNFANNLSKWWSEFSRDPLDWIRRNIMQPLYDKLVEFATAVWNVLPNEIKAILQGIYDFFTKTVPETIVNFIKSVQAWWSEFSKDPLKWITDNVITPFVNKVKEALTFVGQAIWNALPEGLRRFIEGVWKFFIETLPRGIEAVVAQINEFIKDPTKWFQKNVVEPFMNLLKVIWDKLPDSVKNVLRSVFDLFTKRLPQLARQLYNWFMAFRKDPWGWLAQHVFSPLLELAKRIADAIKRGFEITVEVVGKVVSGVTSAVRSFIETMINAVLNIVKPQSPGLVAVFLPMIGVIAASFSPLFDEITKALENALTDRWVKNAKKVEEVLQLGFERAEGIGNQMWWIGAQLMMPYWQSTVMAFALRGLARTLGHLEIRFEPQVAGTKMLGFDIRINVGELLTSVAETLPSYAHAFAIGSSFAIAQLYLQNIQLWYAPRALQYYEKIKDKMIGPIARSLGAPNAVYNAFVRIPSEREILEWAHRWISVIKASQYREEIKESQITVSGDVVPKEMAGVLDTIKLHMYYFGLPKWYVEFISQDPDKFYIAFEDRFGALRKIPLSPLYELPTHSELARMTQRDIFPSVRTMQAVTWVRGWNEDISTMMYLLTFKYPSFEKLWEFYMRATAGMLWFKPPEYARAIFESEAEQVKAGKPISPLDIQNALAAKGAQALQAFETALNLYLKWLEYSNFSWITPGTKLQGVNLGQLVYNTLGGWTADSWLMWDVAADIPTKIDMRWMSRYGIFQYMANRIGEQAFMSYTPMVTAMKAMLDSSPASKLTVELHWFSKLLQATGLHPAWVPIVTVAENIMVIGDEMTLLRTGWINLFKEGLLTFDVMDKALSGLFTVSYKVGYWDPETKQWHTGWINLPVRWLPHERRLLEYRALIDRIMDLYREFYNYMKSAVRTLVLTPEEAKKVLVNFVKLLDAHYSKVAYEITGHETHLKHDAEYLDVWLNMFEQLGLFEAMERARIWWQRISGWLLYRVAYGHVDIDKVIQMLQKLKDLLKLSDIEMNAYITIVDAIYSIISKERIPTPWQLATLAEYMMVPDDLIIRSVVAYNVDEAYREFLYRYVKLRPIKPDYRELIIDAIRALRARKITRDVFDQIVERARDYGFTEPEIAILKMRGEFLSMIYEDVASKSVRVPTPWQLATLAEYMSIPPNLIEKSIKEYNLDPDFAEFVARYILLRPLKSDYRQVISSALRALRYGAITRDVFDSILQNALNYGFTEPELALIQMRAELDLAVDSAREYIPTPNMMATMAEILPEVRDYIAEVFRARRISGVWAKLWTKYIYLRPVADEVRRWLNAMTALVERNMLPMDALSDVLRVLSTYGYEQLEQEIITRTVLSNRARHAWNELLGTARNLTTMSRYSDVAADMAWTRVAKVVDALPVDNATKETIKTMWKQYIIHYQNYPEIRTYVTELVTSYGYGVIDDAAFERELQYLKRLGVPEMTLALIRRRAQLRRLRITATRQRRQ